MGGKAEAGPSAAKLWKASGRANLPGQRSDFQPPIPGAFSRGDKSIQIKQRQITSNRQGTPYQYGSAAPKLDEAVEDLAANAEAPGAPDTGGWRELQPLARREAKQEYPVEALPEKLRAAVAAVSDVMKVPAEMAAMSALSALSAAAQGLVDVCRSSELKLSGPISLYTLSVVESGGRKSAIDKLFTSAIDEFEKRKNKELEPEIKKAKSEHDIWEYQRKGILDKIKREKGGTGFEPSPELLTQELIDHDKKEPRPILVCSILQGDATIEARQRKIATGWPSQAILEAEGGTILSSYSTDKDRVINALSGYNKIWGNETLKIDRIGRDGITVRDVRLTLGIQAQHCVIEELAAKGSGAARGVGFFARFLFSEPDIKFGGRPFEEAALPELDPIHKRIKELLSERLPWGDDGVGIKPRALNLSQDGKAAWIDAYNAIQSQEGEFGEYADVRDVSSKAGENIVRVAAILHVFENGTGGKISAENVRRAERIIRWHLVEYKHFFVGVVLSQEERDAEKLERWLIKYCRQNNCTSVPRRPADKGPGRGSKEGRKKMDDALRVLSDAGRVREFTNGREKIIAVRPGLIDGSEECAF